MTRRGRQPSRAYAIVSQMGRGWRPGSLSVALVISTATLVAACGGAHKSKTSTTRSTVAPTTRTRRKAKPKPVVEEVRRPGTKAYAGSVVAHPGEQLVLHTLLGAKGRQKVSLTIGTGPSKTLSIAATTRGHTSTATVTSSTGKPLTLMKIHYSCALPPAPTFCPASGITANRKRVRVNFTTTRTAPITVLAVVGPVSTPIPAVHNPGVTVVPPYTVTELVRALPKNAKPPVGQPSSSATVHPGDSLVLISRVTSHLRGATQPIKITIDQGPARSVTVSASAPGGQPANATVRSATGSPIALVLARYVCYLPPYPTFCPPLATKVASHRYSLTVAAAPGTAAPVVLATVQAG